MDASPPQLALAGTPLGVLTDIPEGGTEGFTLGEGDWPLRGLLVRVEGQVHAYVNRCPHAGHRLNFVPGRFLTPDGSLIRCQSHGALFDKSTGECVAGPCPGEALTRIPVSIEAGRVQLAADIDIDALAQRPW